MATNAVPRQRPGDNPSPPGRARIGSFLERHRDRLFNIVLHIVGSYDAASEVTRHAFFQVIASTGERHDVEPALEAVIRTVVRASLLHRCHGAAGQSASDDGACTNHADQGAALRGQFQDSPESTEPGCIRYREALACLDEGLCVLLVLRDMDGMTYRQMADVMEISVRNVKSGLLRARLSLRRQMLAVPVGGAPSRGGSPRSTVAAGS